MIPNEIILRRSSFFILEIGYIVEYMKWGDAYLKETILLEP